MKSVLVVLTSLMASSSFAATVWNGSCIAEVGPNTICTSPIVTVEEGLRGYCLDFAQSVGSTYSEVQYDTELDRLLDLLRDRCDEIQDLPLN